ncbi:MAG: hypothetical protein L0287_32690 [Anaerolineae bacterium]|nr:hypothetical protein [Anaerolineae bacterium]
MQNLIRSERFPFWILMIVALFIGIITVHNYGESWDELKLYKYADDSLAAYSTWPLSGEIPFTGGWFENYGPAFMMFSTLTTQALKLVGFRWLDVEVHHLLYFLTFLLGAWSLYQICRRWMGATAALGATLLFATQPLLWGHSFINPKDTTLLSLMLFSVYLGLKMYDSTLGPQADPAFDALTSAWTNLPKSTRRLLVTATVIWLFAILILFGGTPLWHTWFDSSVRAATGGEETLLGPFILRVASNLHEVAPEIYVQKFFVAFIQARVVLFWVSTLILLWLYWERLPSVLRVMGIILPASLALGFTSSVRIFGPLAGILVTQHAIRNTGKKSIVVLAIYATLAIFFMYATWPYLWLDPIGHLVETVTIMSQHFWNGSVLFNGIEYAATDLPSSYMPVLLAIQLTEPVWVLFALGLAVTVYGVVKKREGSRDLFALTIIWLIIPLATFILFRPTMFDNFRHSFLILPMIFVLAGIALDQVRQPLLQGFLILALAAPGVLGAVRLHPYEYMYYNSFAGGVGGAFRKFELDYWGTSYREIALELNRIAPPNSIVWLEGPTHIFETYSRADIGIYSTYEAERADRYDYVVTLSRHQDDLSVYPDAPIIFSVTRDGAIFAVIRKP